METSQKTLIFGFAGLLMLILIVFFFMWRKKNKPVTPAPNTEANATLQAQLQAQMQTQQALLQAQTQTQHTQAQMQAQILAQEKAQALAQAQALLQAQNVPASNEEFPLKVGSYGLRVKKLQTFLAKKYGWSGKIDGKLGTQTMQALKDKFKLTTDDFSQAKYELFNIESIIID